jgi:CheY-like chemotaxis protein
MENETKALEILVVEDNLMHQDAARALLKDHNLTVVGTFDDAMDELKNWQKYDAVLTDLFFPQGRGEMMRDKSMGKIEMPFGYAVSLIASKHGIENIAVVSDANHHDNPIAYTMDFLSGRGGQGPIVQQVGTSRLAVINSGALQQAYLKSDGSVTLEDPYTLPKDSERRQEFARKGEYEFQRVKNWKAALEQVMNAEIYTPPKRIDDRPVGAPPGGRIM